MTTTLACNRCFMLNISTIGGLLRNTKGQFNVVGRGAVSYVLQENFETPTSGYDSGFSWVEEPGTGGSINHANTSSPLRGTQDLVIDAGSTASRAVANLVSTYTECWVHFMFS